MPIILIYSLQDFYDIICTIIDPFLFISGQKLNDYGHSCLAKAQTIFILFVIDTQEITDIESVGF
ncbi:MAG: hypothetical protein A2Y87_11820 [Bacteroidetes bacterium RBG_13_46_8]|nr:MAG: hypothetical protein A2Y87_11820 [Bacteroidetes bacterium RBG_13_46_8]